jgi:hypothetical protein
MNTGYSGGGTIRETHVIVKVKLGKTLEKKKKEKKSKGYKEVTMAQQPTHRYLRSFSRRFSLIPLTSISSSSFLNVPFTFR